MTRPRGYFGHGCVVFTLDGPAVPGGVRERVPGVSLARLRLPDAAARSVAARFYGDDRDADLAAGRRPRR